LFYKPLGKYRSRSEIVYQILFSAKELDGVTKTKIMFAAFLSFAQLKDYLKFLLDSGLLEHIPETNTYRTTAKGMQVLEAYGIINELVSEARGFE
jgi:predicted transcriptional regulator